MIPFPSCKRLATPSAERTLKPRRGTRKPRRPALLIAALGILATSQLTSAGPTAGPASSSAKLFEMSFDRLKDDLDQALRDDSTGQPEDDTIHICEVFWERRICVFNNGVQARTSVALKELGLEQGKKVLALVVDLQDDKPQEVRVEGDRRDISNLWDFIGLDIAVIRVLTGAQLDRPAALALVKQLGLFSGDGSPNLAVPMSVDIKGLHITCNKVSSRLTTSINCSFKPGKDYVLPAILAPKIEQDVFAPVPSVNPHSASECLTNAKRLAAFTGIGLGRQTSEVVFLGMVPGVSEATYGCSTGSTSPPYLFIGWENQPRPPASARRFIDKAGAYLTGETAAAIDDATAACINDAMKPNADELAEHEMHGLKIDCQAYTRDGGAGSVTIYRVYGPYPGHTDPSTSAMVTVDRLSDAIKQSEDRKAASALAWAQKWLDPTVSGEVKTFAMMAARVKTLEERCPSAKNHNDKIVAWAAEAGVTAEDISPGGRYFAIMDQMLTEMRNGVMKDSVDTACADAHRYD